MRTADTLGVIGLPKPVQALAAKRWDAIVIGAGHNGLTCATYLARGGKRVLVLEARERVGGACTLEEVWPGVRMSPCAYLAGPLHPLVIDELDLPGHGFEWTQASAGLFTPFEPGTASIRFHHETGRINGTLGTWGYVKGGMGMVSFMLCDIAREHGVTVASGVPVAQIVPGQGVLLEGGECIDAPVVVSNADPVVTLRLLGDAADPAWAAR